MVGDCLCLMQGKYDKRANKSAVRPEHQVDNYLDAVIDTFSEFLKPYANQLIVMSEGNHEAAIRKRHETHMVERVIALLNTNPGVKVYNGGFSGWVFFNFRRSLERLKGTAQKVKLHYDHGYGGGGAVTADMIQHQRRTTYLPDADIVISGHVHESWMREFGRKRVTSHGIVYQDTQLHLKMPSYKDDYGDGFSGWHVETGKSPRPLGAWWLRFFWSHRDDAILYEPIRAK